MPSDRGKHCRLTLNTWRRGPGISSVASTARGLASGDLYHTNEEFKASVSTRGNRWLSNGFNACHNHKRFVPKGIRTTSSTARHDYGEVARTYNYTYSCSTHTHTYRSVGHVLLHYENLRYRQCWTLVFVMTENKSFWWRDSLGDLFDLHSLPRVLHSLFVPMNNTVRAS